MKDLTPRQRRFVGEYLKDLNATQAAIRAGYSEKNARVIGPRLLLNVAIREAVERKLGRAEAKSEVTAEYLVEAAKEILERCMQRRPVMVRQGKDWVQKTEENENGEEVGVWEFDAQGAVAAANLLAKHKAGFLAPTKTELTGKDGANLKITFDPGTD